MHSGRGAEQGNLICRKKIPDLRNHLLSIMWLNHWLVSIFFLSWLFEMALFGLNQRTNFQLTKYRNFISINWHNEMSKSACLKVLYEWAVRYDLLPGPQLSIIFYIERKTFFKLKAYPMKSDRMIYAIDFSFRNKNIVGDV